MLHEVPFSIFDSNVLRLWMKDEMQGAEGEGKVP